MKLFIALLVLAVMLACELYDRETHIVENFYLIDNQNYQQTIAYSVPEGGYIMLVQDIDKYYRNDSILIVTLPENKGFHVIQLKGYNAYNIEKSVSKKINMSNILQYSQKYGVGINGK